MPDLHAMRFRRSALAHVLLAVALVASVSACRTAAPADTSGAAPHHVDLPDADALAAWLAPAGRPGAGPARMLSAHRGGDAPGYPENAVASMERALTFAPALLEVDVRMTRDSVLVLMHDETLDRTTTGTGRLDARTLAELRALRLRDPEGRPTGYAIPTLDEVLAWSRARAVLTLDVKPGVPAARVVEAVRRHGAANRVVVIGYSLDDLLAFHRLAPELVFSANIPDEAALQAHLESPLDASRLIAFTSVGDVRPALIEALGAAGIRPMMATFGALDAEAAGGAPIYNRLFDYGIEIIATDRVDLAAPSTR